MVICKFLGTRTEAVARIASATQEAAGPCAEDAAGLRSYKGERGLRSPVAWQQLEAGSLFS